MTSLTDASQTCVAAATAGLTQSIEAAKPRADSSSRPVEHAVQDIAGLASLICETPFAVLTLRDYDVTWFSSGRRIDGNACPQHNPCDEYAIRCTELFEVLDAALDERFAAIMPLINGHTARFYTGVPILAADGSAVGTLAVLDAVPRCLTARQRAALLLLARHGRSQLALCEKLIVAQARVENAPVAIYQTDERGLITYANPEYRRFLSLGPTESLDNWANGVRIESHANLQRAETLFQNTFEQAPISIVYADRDGRVLRSNQTFCKLLGFNSRQIETMSIAELTHDADVTHNAAEFERLWNGAIGVVDVETRYLCMDGRAVWVRVTTALLRDASGAPTCAVEFIRDISARKDLSAALLENQRLLEAVIADIPFAIRACDVEGRVFLHNPAAAAFFAIGTTDDSASTVEFFLPDGKTPVPIEERPMARALRGETVTDMDLVIARPGEPARATRSSGRRLSGQNGDSLGAVTVTQDVTQEKKLERDLAHAHKLESIGQLAAGIAHEINTPTQFIGDNIRFLRDSFQDILGLVAELKALIAAATGGGAVAMAPIASALGGPDVTYLQDEIPKAISQSLEGVERIAKIVGAMKEFSHPSTDRTPLDLNRAIASTITVASNEWKYVADIKTEFDPQLPHIPVMPGSFNQVILNMIVNAAHAISAAAPDATSAKGTITVTTRRVNDWVEIGITDTGCGIPASTIPRIFDQFFTTKPVGKGTGQGLAIAHDVVVTKHGGTITVESVPGVGTTFTLRLPMKGATAPSAEAA